MRPLRHIRLGMSAAHSSAANTAASLESHHFGMWSRSGSNLNQQNCKGGWSKRGSSCSFTYSENGAPATRSAKFGGVKPSTYRIPKSRRMLSIAVIGF